jgi:hypothetical protein
MTLAAKTRYVTHRQTAERLYASMQIGAGIHATGRPYPVKRWDDLTEPHRKRLMLRAAVFVRLGDATTPMDLPERLHTAWWHAHAKTVVPYRRSAAWVHAMWEEIAAAYTALDREREAA